MTYRLPEIIDENIFESLCCDLFNDLYATQTFQKQGRKGSKQKGIDLFSESEKVIVQCKKKDMTRSPNIIKKELYRDIENDLDKAIAGGVIRDNRDFFFLSTFKDDVDLSNYCMELKQEYDISINLHFWGWDTISSKICDNKKLLSKYYYDLLIEKKTSLKVKAIDLKKQIEKDFNIWINVSPEKRERRSRMLIHDIENSMYPKQELFNGYYTWFGSEFINSEYDGISFYAYSEINYIEFLGNGKWRVADENSKDIIAVNAIGIIKYEDIIRYDLEGDDMYNCPQFYCDFKYDNSPFYKVCYESLKRKHRFYEEDRLV